jgi:hypothetical protein
MKTDMLGSFVDVCDVLCRFWVTLGVRRSNRAAMLLEEKNFEMLAWYVVFCVGQASRQRQRTRVGAHGKGELVLLPLALFWDVKPGRSLRCLYLKRVCVCVYI